MVDGCIGGGGGGGCGCYAGKYGTPKLGFMLGSRLYVQLLKYVNVMNIFCIAELGVIYIPYCPFLVSTFLFFRVTAPLTTSIPVINNTAAMIIML